MAEKFVPSTPPNTPERWREVQEWAAQQNKAAVDALLAAVTDPQLRLRTKIAEQLADLERDDA